MSVSKPPVKPAAQYSTTTGTISQATRQRLQRSLDLEAARLGDDLR